MDEAVAIGPAMAPALQSLLDEVLAAPEAFTAYGNEDYVGHLYALALLTHWGVADAHPQVVRLAQLPEVVGEKLLGLAVAELLPAALHRTRGGSHESLRALAADPSVAMGCRDAALGALAFGALVEPDARADVLGLFGAFLSEPDRRIADMEFVSHVASRALDLYPAEIMPTIEQAFRKGRVDPFTIALADFERLMAADEQEVLADSRRALDELLPADVHGYLTRFAAFPESEESRARDAKARKGVFGKQRKQDRKRTRKARKRRR